MNTLSTLENEIKLISENYKDETIGGWISGDGPVPCDILFIGEAPGKNEVELRKPFVGTAGKTLEKYLNLSGLNRTNIRITNTCYFRPITKSITKNNKTSIKNRTPKDGEILLFKEVLYKEIKLVNPKIIITLGNTPLKSFTPFKAIGQCHGKLIMNEHFHVNIFPMYHPSALTYNRNESFEEIFHSDWVNLGETLKSMKII